MDLTLNNIVCNINGKTVTIFADTNDDSTGIVAKGKDMSTPTHPMTFAQVEAGIRQIEARPVAEHAHALLCLWRTTVEYSDAEHAVKQATVRMIPEVEALPAVAERAKALVHLYWIVRDDSDAKRMIGEVAIQLIATAEAAPVAECACALDHLRLIVSAGSVVRQAVEQAAVRAIPKVEALPAIADRTDAFLSLYRATRTDIDAQRTVEEAMTRSRLA